MTRVIRAREVALRHNPSHKEPLKGLTARGKTPGTPITGAKQRTMVQYPSTYNKNRANKTKKKKKKKGKERTSVFYCHGITLGSQIRNSQTVNNFLSD